MKKSAFTLIELMIVLVIIGILMSLTLAGVLKAMESAKVSKAEATIATLEIALCAYETDIGDYPPTCGWFCNRFKTWLYDGDTTSGWNGPYMSFKSEDLNGNEFLDPWGLKYGYGRGTGRIWIWSGGADGINGSPDDITNW